MLIWLSITTLFLRSERFTYFWKYLAFFKFEHKCLLSFWWLLTICLTCKMQTSFCLRSLQKFGLSGLTICCLNKLKTLRLFMKAHFQFYPSKGQPPKFRIIETLHHTAILNFCANSTRSKTWSRKTISWRFSVVSIKRTGSLNYFEVFSHPVLFFMY